MIESNSKTIQHSCFPSPSILDLTSPRYHRPMHVHWPSGKRITCNKMTDRSSFFSTHGDKRSQNKVEDGPRDPTKLGNALWTQKCGTNFCKQKNWDIPSCIPVNYPHSIRPRRRRHSSNSCIGDRTHYRYQLKCQGRQSRLNSLPVRSDVKRDRKRIAECKFEMMSCPFRQICQPCSERRYV